MVFFDDGTPLATAHVNSGVATLDNVHLPAGVDSIAASYVDPGGNFASSSTRVGLGSTIETVAGGALQNGLSALDASVSPQAVAVDSSGDLFIADSTLDVVLKVSHATGLITTVAGNGTAGFSGDGGPATAAEFNDPEGVAVDSFGDLFIADRGNNRIREVDHATDIITTVAGSGTWGFSGDGGPATAAELNDAQGVAVDSSGDLFIVDSNNERVREVDHATGVITTVAGNGAFGFGGDGGLATAAEFRDPMSVAVNSSGDLFIADLLNERIREVDLATGVITTAAGNGTRAYSGDGGPATAAEVDSPQKIAVDTSGDLFISDGRNNRVREVNHATGVITTVAGNGMRVSGSFGAFGGDGGPATAAQLDSPDGIALDTSGDLFIADSGNERVREVNLTTGIITTVAGDGAYGSGGDGGPATAAQLSYPTGVAVDSSGNLFITDWGDSSIREVNHATGIITTVAGNGTGGYSGDGGPATAAEFFAIEDIAVDSSGDLIIADSGNDRIREVNLTTGIITTVAGDGIQGSSGDGGPATAASLLSPIGIAVDSSGNLFIVDNGNNRIREVDLATGIITTAAGNGTTGFSGDGGPAVAAELSEPTSVAVDSSGNLFIAEMGDNRIREVASSDTVVNVAPAPLTITADDRTKEYGAALPVLTASYSGFVNGDSAASLTTLPTLSTTATAGSHVSGSPYSITASGAVDPDYTISYVPGTLTVTPAALTITADDKSKVYGAALPALTASYAGFVNGDSAASLTTQPTLSTTATVGSHVSGSPYTITAAGAVNADYNISYMAGRLTVSPATLTVQANDASKVQGAVNPVFSDTIGGFVNGDTSSVVIGHATLSTTATTASDAGIYPITVSPGTLSAPDYTFAFANGTLTVIPRPTANPDTFVLGPGGTVSGSGATSVLANDTSADAQPQNLVAKLVSTTTNGTLTLNADGSFVFTPGANFQGIDRFTYQVSDAGVLSNAVTVTLLSYNASLVDKLYQQVLDRSAEDSGLIYWTAQLDAGQPLDVVATAIFNSTERLDPLVTQFYHQFLDRDTDPGGLAYWVTDWQTKGDPRDLVENILASQEFFDDAGDTNTGYVTLLYQRVLDRAAEPSGLAYWLGLMSPPTDETRLQIASQFYDTHEKHADLVDNLLFAEYFQGVTPLPDATPYITDLDNGETETQVELREAHPLGSESIEIRRRDLAAVTANIGETQVIDQHDDDVRPFGGGWRCQADGAAEQAREQRGFGSHWWMAGTNDKPKRLLPKYCRSARGHASVGSPCGPPTIRRGWAKSRSTPLALSRACMADGG